MSLQQFALPLVSENSFIKASFGGFAGSGKTTTATHFIIGVCKHLGLTKPGLLIDNEKGSRFLIPIFKKAGIECLVKETTSLRDIHTCFDYLAKGEISFLFIDSLTKVYQAFVNDYMSQNNRKAMQLNDWGKVIPDWQKKFADKLVECPGNIVFTGRGGYEYDMEKDEETGKKQFVRSGVKMKVAGDTPFEPDLNIWMERKQSLDDHDNIKEVWREAVVIKDRSAIIDGQTFRNPEYTHFKPVIDFLIGTPKGEVKQMTDGRPLAVKDLPADGTRKIHLEEIQGSLTSLFPGRGDQDKKMKLDILDILFSTRAWAGIEAKQSDELRPKSELLKSFTKDTLELAASGNVDWNERLQYLMQEKVKLDQQ